MTVDPYFAKLAERHYKMGHPERFLYVYLYFLCGLLYSYIPFIILMYIFKVVLSCNQLFCINKYHFAC